MRFDVCYICDIYTASLLTLFNTTCTSYIILIWHVLWFTNAWWIAHYEALVSHIYSHIQHVCVIFAKSEVQFFLYYTMGPHDFQLFKISFWCALVNHLWICNQKVGNDVGPWPIKGLKGRKIPYFGQNGLPHPYLEDYGHIM